jgi:indole-3-glycerol phosphate synthase
VPTNDFLEQIIDQKKKDLKKDKTFFSFWKLRLRAQSPHLRRFFRQNISRPGRLNLIAEIKMASPSRGVIRRDFDPVKLARVYEEAGAAALSVLTEEYFFKGGLDYLGKVRRKTRLPLLRKDFIIDEFQIYESYVYGADAILLIAELLEEKQLADFIKLGRRLGLDCLVEVHSVADLEKALAANARIIGINNRDLHTFQIDLSTASRLKPLIPANKIVVCESGIKSADQVAFVKGLGVNAVLIGEAFLETDNIPARIKELMSW